MVGKTELSKIGILTWHYYSNVGSNLQAWAMQHVLKSMGFDAKFVNYRKREFDGDRFPKSVVKAIVGTLPFGPSLDTWRFQRRQFRQTSKTYDPAEAVGLCDGFDAVVCGSDQIWAPNVFDPVYMLDGVSNRVRKISYAASIGISTIPEEMKPVYRDLLSRFDFVGVREEQGRQLLEKLGIRATAVLDPTLLLDKDAWNSIADHGSVEPGCVFCYFLGDPGRYKEAVEEAARVQKAPVVAYLPEGGDAPIPGCRVIRRMGPAEFLSWVDLSNLVLTDSFHGIALSVVYRTDFVAFMRFSANSPINQNSRVENILTKLDLMGRLTSGEVMPNGPIDWEGVGMRLEAEREGSRMFLSNALEMRDA